MKQLVNTVLVIGLCLLLTACGFHIRGADSAGMPADRVYLDIGGSGDTGREVREQLQLTDTVLTETAEESEYILRVTNQQYNRSVLSVSPRTGKVEEYELTQSVLLSVATPEGETLVSNERISASRDYIFDETAVIASGDEQQLLREEMTRQIANLALLRARSAIHNHQQQQAATAAAD